VNSERNYKHMKSINYLFLLFLIFVLNSCSENTVVEKIKNQNKEYRRIVSLAPSLTEILYVLDADTQIAGVSEFCVYPEDAKTKTKIGGYMNINFEQLMILQPDLILALDAHQSNFQKFDQLGFEYVMFSQNSVETIRNTIFQIGDLIGKEKEAEIFLDKFDNTFLSKNISFDKESVQKVLIIVGREFGKIRSVVCAGQKTFYNDLIEYAGGRNAAPYSNLEYNSINAESILSMNPDIIIEIYTPHQGMHSNFSPDVLRSDWDILSSISAVQNNCIYYIIEDYATVSGPRIYLLYQDIKNIINSNE
jgi:iron complex transport system substrate-binding protein